MPKGSDEKFVSKLNQIFDENAATKSVYFTRQRRSPMDFTVRHFAGDVTYNAKVRVLALLCTLRPLSHYHIVSGPCA
jgi:myosin heavy subunit